MEPEPKPSTLRLLLPQVARIGGLPKLRARSRRLEILAREGRWGCITCLPPSPPLSSRSLSLYIYIYVRNIYIRIYTYIHVYIYTYVHIHVQVYVHMYICIHVYMYICIDVYMHICIYVYRYICIYAYMYICVYVYVYICISVYVHVYVSGGRQRRSRPSEKRTSRTEAGFGSVFVGMGDISAAKYTLTNQNPQSCRVPIFTHLFSFSEPTKGFGWFR